MFTNHRTTFLAHICMSTLSTRWWIESLRHGNKSCGACGFSPWPQRRKPALLGGNILHTREFSRWSFCFDFFNIRFAGFWLARIVVWNNRHIKLRINPRLLIHLLDVHVRNLSRIWSFTKNCSPPFPTSTSALTRRVDGNCWRPGWLMVILWRLWWLNLWLHISWLSPNCCLWECKTTLQNYTSVDPKQFTPANTPTWREPKGAKTSWEPKEGSHTNQHPSPHKGSQDHPRRRPHQPTPNPRWREPKGAKTTSEPKNSATPTNTKAAKSKVALRNPTVNCLGKNTLGEAWMKWNQMEPHSTEP